MLSAGLSSRPVPSAQAPEGQGRGRGCHLHHHHRTWAWACPPHASSWSSRSPALGGLSRRPPPPLGRRGSVALLPRAQGSKEALGEAQRLQESRVGGPDPGGPGGDGGGEGEDKGFGFFDLEAFNSPWDVPWGFGSVAFGMALWLTSFATVGLVLSPLAFSALGLGDIRAVAKVDQLTTAEFTLINQVFETMVGLASIYLVVGKFEARDDLFKVTLERPFGKPDGWAVWAFWGILLAPLVVGLVSYAVEASTYDTSGRGTVDEVVKMVDMDGSTYASLLTVTGVLAPLLEETVFRGFLLTSLTKWMPTSLAVLVSAMAFGVCHLSPADFPQLVALGTVLGFAYVRSRNLLTPMIIHGAWNSTVITILYALASSGVDLSTVLERGAQRSYEPLEALVTALGR